MNNLKGRDWCFYYVLRKWNRTNSTKLLKIKAQNKKAEISTILILEKMAFKLYFNLKIICLSKTRKANNSWGQPSHGQELTRKYKGNQSLVWEGGMALIHLILWKLKYIMCHCTLSPRSWPEGKFYDTKLHTRTGDQVLDKIRRYIATACFGLSRQCHHLPFLFSKCYHTTLLCIKTNSIIPFILVLISH